MSFGFKCSPLCCEGRAMFESPHVALGRVGSMKAGRCFKGSFLRDFLLKAAIVWLRESQIHSAPSGILEHTRNTEKNDDSRTDLMIKFPPTPHKCLWLSSGRELSCWKLNLVHLGSGGNPVLKINMRVFFEVVCSSKAQSLCLYYA